ncbi:hypothetical protein [Rhodococcus koreensis]|uniref:hypothetical protein n=1 Tax=Rhodococcus koreensis TaxID=99653 RepID=UPI00366B44F9
MDSTYGAAVPAPLARRPLCTFRPQDATDVYAHPRPELPRLVKRGVVHRAAPAIHRHTPELAGRPWIPNLEATAIVTPGIGP